VCRDQVDGVVLDQVQVPRVSLEEV
jgi:hypothetical protein